MPTIEPRPLNEMRVVAPPPATPMRRFRTPHTVFPHSQFLSNGNYVTIVTNAGGGSSSAAAWPSRSRDAIRRVIQAASCLPARCMKRRGLVGDLSSNGRGTRRVCGRIPRRDRATFRRHDDEIVTQLDVAVSTEDDVEVRRLTVANQSDRTPARSTSRATWRSRWLRRRRISRTRRSANCSSRPSICAASSALLAHRRPRDSSDPAVVGRSCVEPRRPYTGTDRMGNGSGPVPRPRTRHGNPARKTAAVVRHDRHRARSHLQPSSTNQVASLVRWCAPRLRHGITRSCSRWAAPCCCSDCSRVA